MRFGAMPLAEAEGAVLAHALRRGGLQLKKGRRLGADDLRALRDAGVAEVVAAAMGPGDVPEDEAAARLAAAVAGPGLEPGAAFTGRVNLFANADGLLLVDAPAIDRLNGLDESLTVATLPAFAPVRAGDMAATVKVIPFAAPRPALAAALELATAGGAGAAAAPLRLAPFRPLRARLIQTEFEGTSPKMLDKTVRVTADRLAGVGGELLGEARCAHAAAAVAAAIRDAEARGFDLLLLAGASAIADRRDALPGGVEAAGGRVLRFGMPVDPGNLLLLAELRGRPVLGLPGCARSPKANGFDWVLERLAAGLAVTGADVAGMGVGGLLTEIPTRPQPRAGGDRPAGAAAGRPPPRVAAVVLAAGRSRRMGGPNKLLAPVDGRPMAAHAVAAALGSGAFEVVVVLGHEADAVEAALRPPAPAPRLRFVRNPDFARGLSTSLRAGLAALPPEAEGAVVCLGDMPRVAPALIDRLIAAFDPAAGRSVAVPVRAGRRGNPVLWGRAHWGALAEVEGDVGGRHLLEAPGATGAPAEVEVEDDAALLDVDTPEALAALAGAPAP